MTQQEKATELVRKYYQWGIRKEGQTLSWEESKQCALIAVDEILKSIPLKRYWETYVDERPSAITYWEEVKQEIELL